MKNMKNMLKWVRNNKFKAVMGSIIGGYALFNAID